MNPAMLALLAARAASGVTPLSVSWLTHRESTADLSEYTFTTDIAPGHVVVGVATRNASAPGISAVTIGGEPASLIIKNDNGGSEAGLFYAENPTTNPNVVVTLAAPAVRCAIGLYSATREPVIAGTASIDGALTASLPAGIAIAAQSGGNASSVTFSPVTIAEDRDALYESGSYAFGHGPHPGGSVSAVPTGLASLSSAVFASLS